MTDLEMGSGSIPGRLGATAQVVDGQLVLALRPQAEVLHHGIVRTSVLAYLVDCVAGITFDVDATAWSLTSDLSVKACPVEAPACITGTCEVVRAGKRTTTAAVDLTGDDGEAIAVGVVGFTRVAVPPAQQPRLTFSLDDI